jgi:hypothetical protein
MECDSMDGTLEKNDIRENKEIQKKNGTWEFFFNVSIHQKPFKI